ncbi:hypothetical protein B0T11DRAFT_56204 [Plectosphaerella cucumerina]|uniref:Nucleic acid-binding, OB-fold protein n=1 Tax=Plectosphaerella cucumerina TaxID=40658 RepID=A0A8K0TJN1_9PEZI|nr:hypothetical protein B0T11DRAFT_56204 [Plectosphaerella cucumerina]
MSPKVILFTGAPDPATFDQGMREPLDNFTPPISTFLGLHTTQVQEPGTLAAWRSLPLKPKPLRTGLTQDYDLPAQHRQPDSHFFTMASISFDSTRSDQGQTTTLSLAQSQENQQILSQFYDESLARHDDVRSSQLPAPEETTASYDTDASTSLLGSAPDENTSVLSARPPLPASAHLSDIEDVPKARDLLALAPATVTVNLIAGIISIAPKEVVTRWGRHMSLVELLLGDDTRSGFAVTFWLPGPGARSVVQETQEATLASLRRQDVVLIQNVALHVFRGKVYGQSLRKNLTRVHLLHRRLLDDDDEGGYYRTEHLRSNALVDPQLEKTRKVRDWVLRFVGSDAPAGHPGRKKRGWDVLPDDTQ